MLTSIIELFLLNEHSLLFYILTFFHKDWFDCFSQKVIAFYFYFPEIQRIIEMLFCIFADNAIEFFMQRLLQINTTEKIWDFNLPVNQISKRQTNRPLLCSWIIGDHITKSLCSRLLLYLTKKFFYDITVFITC